jgi:hypothetical protein
MTADKFLKLYQGVVANVVNMGRILHDRCGVTISPCCDKLPIAASGRAAPRPPLQRKVALSDEHTFIDPSALRSTDSLPVRTAMSDLLDLERVAAHEDAR